MEIEIQSFAGSKDNSVEKVALNKSVFAVENNEGLVHQMITTFQTRARQGTRATKNRSAVRGGGRKPWRQKGTGRARAGTRSSPIWVGGGHTFAKSPYDYSKSLKLNRKMYRLGLKCIFSQHVEKNTLKVVDNIELASHKTKEFIKQIQPMQAKRTLIITEDISDNLDMASRNVPNVYCITPCEINPVAIFGASQIIMTKAALEAITESLS